ncbi:hypothetical protein [Streptomyces tagetis]|uniref:Uncharacterized protein n=1 Tax=Streptomyces tagetis TaxID=2820809 RepID=A0A940XN13_9ACTN|nr:hypothetical protein [Streptomyces sp. RG38]MBQ0829296.1 hypothetical protein [Streptomyces sp. RG38]
MGIESDQVVYEYLSRVGDVAQQRQLPSATRMRLVAELRDEIDRHRARTTVDSPAAVRRILDRLGSPDDIVEAAGGTSAAPAAPRHTPAAVPLQPDGPPGAPKPPRAAENGGRRKGLRWPVPRPRATEPEAGPPPPSPPHTAGAHELGDLGEGAREPDWWRVDDGPFGGVGDGVPGFVGGVELPELLRPPQRPPGAEERVPPGVPGEAVVAAAEEEAAAAGPAGLRRRLLRLWPRGGWNSPLLLCAAALLIAGAVLGSLLPLGLGWLIVYLSRRLTPAQTKWAVLGLPGTVAVAGVVWLWGRADGRWGDPVLQGQMSDAVAGTWPWVLRGAALASALYLLWQSRRAP